VDFVQFGRYRNFMALTTSDLIVLAVLLRTGPMHGYDVWRQLEASDVRDWARVSRPQIYYSLRKLAASDHLQRTDEAGPSRGPERSTFQATPAASEALKEALRADLWTERDPPTPFLTWSALAHLAEPETIERQLARRREKLEAEIGREETTIQALANVAGRDAAIGRALVAMAINQMRAEAQGLTQLSKALLLDDSEDGP
jgi:DNA-binding PadR family transcriptional regulator